MKILSDDLFVGRDFPVLGAGEIHLWRVSLDPSESILISCKEALSDFELSRLEFFEFDQVRRSYTVSQGMLRILLSNYLGIKPREVEVGRRAKGKPYSMQDESLFFNISNSGGLCVFAFSRENEVGIDLEKVRPLEDLDEMIVKNFKTSEQKYITKDKDEKLRRFFLYWTIKESYLKGIGEGMRIEPQNLEFEINNAGIELLSVNGTMDYDDWIFREIPFDNQYIRTLTFFGESIRFHDFEIQ